MGKINFSLLAMLFITAVWIQSPVYAEGELTARQIMEMAEKENKTEDRTYLMSMEIRRGKAKRIRELKMWAKTNEMGNDRSMIIFHWPKEVKGTGFLTVEHTGRDDDLWLYLPAIKKVRRIASSSKGGNFMGSDFSYADIGSGNLDDYTYTLSGTETLDGNICYIIEAIPGSEKIKKNEGYSKKIIWVRKDIFYPIQQKYFDKKGYYLKIMKSHSLKKIEEAGVWIAAHIVMANAQKKDSETIMELKEIEVNTGIPDDFFTQRNLTRRF